MLSGRAMKRVELLYKHVIKRERKIRIMSNKTVEQLVKDAKMNPLGLDDEFYFGCNGCGKCCSHMDILLSAYDVYCLARHLNMKTEEIVRDYCVVTAGCESGLPIVYIRLKDGRCPFLDGQRCGVQKAKPFVCAACSNA